MDYLPLFLDLRGKDCLVVGGGTVALRKIELLSRAGANVTVVAEQFSKSVSAQATSNRVQLVERAYQESDVARRSLVVAATDDAATNARIFEDCRSADTLVNTVDAANLSSAIFPSIVDRDPVLVAVSTGGRSPTLARVVRGWLETRLPPGLGALAEFAAARRAEVSKKIRSSKARQKFWDSAINGAVGERVLRGDARGAEESFNQALSETSQGLVSLVGPYIWGYDDETPEASAALLLTQKKLTLGTLETCTGGYLASSITDVPASSTFFKGGMVIHSVESAVAAGLSSAILEKHGLASQEAAVAMARAAQEHLKADVGIGLTGVGGPEESFQAPGIEEVPVGMVHIAISLDGTVTDFSTRLPPRRTTIRRRASSTALIELRKLLSSLPD